MKIHVERINSVDVNILGMDDIVLGIDVKITEEQKELLFEKLYKDLGHHRVSEILDDICPLWRSN